MQRQTELKNWLQTVYPERDFDLSFAAADADFRRYFRRGVFRRRQRRLYGCAARQDECRALFEGAEAV